MPTRILHHLRANAVAYVALFFALGGGGGYALAAASRPKTITVCADKHTGVLHLHNASRCARGQTRVTWNVQGPAGATGAAGAPATKAWALVGPQGQVPFGMGQGIVAQQTGVGTYQITVTAPACQQSLNVPVVTVSDANPPSGQPAPGPFPVAWIEDGTGLHGFTVFTGLVFPGGGFTATDHTFNVQDAC